MDARIGPTQGVHAKPKQRPNINGFAEEEFIKVKFLFSTVNRFKKILNKPNKTINDPEIFNKESLFTFKNIPKDVAVSPKSIKTEQKEKTKMIL